MRSVKTGPQEGELMVIESGVDAGELVVTGGVDKLEDGAQVVIGREEELPSATQGGIPSAAGTMPASSTKDAAATGQQRGRRKRPAQ
jgi:multidrug efflux system membrane fusion protein